MSNILNKILHFLWADVLIMFVLDSMFSWFTPRWRRHTHMVYTGGKRYLNYKRDLLTQEQINTLQTNLDEIKQSLVGFRKETAEAAAGRLETYVDSLPGQSTRNALAENAEVFFVIFVIFLGICAYIAKPFRIPTGSMQPSLNGIIIHPYDEKPSFFKIVGNKLAYGSSYYDEKAETNMRVVGYAQTSKFLLFTYTTIKFDNNLTLDIPCSDGELMRYMERTHGTRFPSFSPGDTIIKGRIDAGDLIIVNKMAYHFRKPELGETFVFDTRGIEGIIQRSRPGQEHTHYVKRLCGLPGDAISIDKPNLIINGRKAEPWTIQRVMDCRPPYNPEGYMPVAAVFPTESDPRPLPRYLTPGRTLRLKKDAQVPALNQYCALGDNTESSLDSRYWGPVNQYNITGPACFALWPFTSHWGIIP